MSKHVRWLIGTVEQVDLPEWGIESLPAKIDTGARSSALHVENIEVLGDGRVRFDVRLHRKKRTRRVHVVATIARQSRVRPSSGHSELRFFVKTTVRIGPVEREVELSLVDRERMLYRMLLGRTTVATDFLIDAGGRYLLTKPRAKRNR
jgi:hypothetical protein